MTKSAEVQELTRRLDAATNEIASDLKALRDKIADGTVSDGDVAGLNDQIARLEALGADPADPVPTEG